MSGLARRAAAALVAGSALSAAAAPASTGWTPPAPPARPGLCAPDPLAGRTLYLRGSFNGWAADEAQRFVWTCNRWQLVTALSGEHRFKLGDEDWNAQAAADGLGDLGLPPVTAQRPKDASSASRPTPGSSARIEAEPALAPKGGELVMAFHGTHRLTLWPGAAGGGAPRLRIEHCPVPAPLGSAVLYLRGTLNDWAAKPEHALTYACDAYWLNLRATGRQMFKVADADWTPATIAPANGGMHTEVFEGEHTLRLAFDAQGRPELTTGPLAWPDKRPQPLADPVAAGLRYDSRDAAHKQPFGAVPAGSTVRFVVTAPPGVGSVTLVVEQRTLEGDQTVLRYSPRARVPMQRTAIDGGRERFSAEHRFDTVAVHGYWFEAEVNGQRYVLHNNADAVAWTREKGSGGPGSVALMPAAGAASPTAIRRYRLSVYRPDFTVPAWAQQAVYYYVFPERFRNGDKTNDPKPGTRRYQTHDVEAHPRWIGTPYKPGTGDGSDAVHNNDFFGGDLAGLIDKLPHLQRLGITAIYSTPLFLAASNHKYDTADYQRIDPGFGSNADFERLTAEAGKRGMRFIPDASLNHTGSDSVYFDRYGNHGGTVGAFAGGRPNPASPYASWYRFDATQSDPDKRYTGWAGVADLPELDKSAPAWRAFAYRAPDSVTRQWLQRGAAGWRMDVAPWVPDDFWREWRGVVKATKPDAVAIAETWFDPAKHLLGDMFDSTMNYIFRNAVLDWAAGGSAQAMAAQLEHLREQVPPPAFHALMNLLSSHDVARAAWVLGDKGPDTPAAARALARQRYRLAVLLQMSYPGAPAVYYGDEVGLGGGDDPYNRAPYPWADAGGQPDLALEDEFRRLIALRRAHPVLSMGTLLAPLHVDAQAMVLARRLGEGAAATWAVTGYSNADAARSVRVALPAGVPAGARFTELLSGAEVVPRDGMLDLRLPARHGVVLVQRR